jgi:NTE family protein/lysophospholipid hydrolase
VRASVSLPGIFPPVYDGGDLLVDGGALNNVPADLMRDRVGTGCVIAVSVAAEMEPFASAAYEPGLSGWRVFGQRLNPFVSPPPVPRVADIVTRSISLSQLRYQRAALEADQVDLLLQPPVGTLGGLSFKAAAALIETGYAYAVEALAASGLAERFVH